MNDDLWAHFSMWLVDIKIDGVYERKYEVRYDSTIIGVYDTENQAERAYIKYEKEHRYGG